MNDFANRESRVGTVGLTLLRMVTGVILTAHGWEKLVGYREWHDNVVSLGLPFPDVLAPLAIAGELAGGVGLVLGLLTRVAGLGAAITMAVAIATVHISHGLFARNNGFEFPLLLLTSSLFFVLRGGGAASLDALWSRRPGDRVVENRHYRRGRREPAPHHDAPLEGRW
jgi:putative oxidoreductase